MISTSDNMTMKEELTKTKERWDFNQERNILENLLQQRFNFLVVVFSLIVAAGTAANSLSELNLVLVVGFLLCTFLGLSVYRIFTKVDAVLQMIHSIDEHPMHIIHKVAKSRKWRFSYGANNIIGYIVPIFCILVIVVWALLANIGCILVK